MMALTRLLLIAVWLACGAVATVAHAQGGRMQPAGAVSLIGPDGLAGEAIRHALLEPWQARGGAVRYAGAATPAQALRRLAALRAQAPADLVLLDAHTADQAASRGLVVRPPADTVPGLAELSPLAREAARACAPIGFDALALSYGPAGVGPLPRGLEILGEAPLRDRLALPAATETLGAYLVALLAQRAAGDWRLTDAGLRQLAALRGGDLALAAGDPPAAGGAEAAAGVAVMWNSEAQLARAAAAAADRPAVLIPAEGTILRPLLLCLSASAPNLRGALALLDFALGAEGQAALAAALHIAPSRAGVELPAAVRARVPDLSAAFVVLPDAGFIARLRGALAAQAPEASGGEAGARN